MSGSQVINYSIKELENVEFIVHRRIIKHHMLVLEELEEYSHDHNPFMYMCTKGDYYYFKVLRNKMKFYRVNRVTLEVESYSRPWKEWFHEQILFKKVDPRK